MSHDVTKRWGSTSHLQDCLSDVSYYVAISYGIDLQSQRDILQLDEFIALLFVSHSDCKLIFILLITTLYSKMEDYLLD